MDFNEMGGEEDNVPTDENAEIDEYAEEERVYSPDEVFEVPEAEAVGPAMAVAIAAEAPRKRHGWRIFLGIVFGFSVLMNLMLLIAIVAMSMFSFGGSGKEFDENTIAKGKSGNKIAVIKIEGIINSEMSAEFRKQIKRAREDRNVKAVIVRTVTPGGGVAASDQIHHEISKFRKETKKPVVAFMQTVAASGGYYTSVACDRIVAEPTVITGSIGVIMNHLVLKQLLEEKLGIFPVTIKSGEKKDWPSPFSEMTDEQRVYLEEKLIGPAYSRFVKLVDEGRSELNMEQVLALADGSIYGGPEALENGLVDEVGYIETAIEAAKKLAGIKSAKVVEYTRQFTISSFFGAESKALWKLDRDVLHKLTTPEVLYLWDGRN